MAMCVCLLANGCKKKDEAQKDEAKKVPVSGISKDNLDTTANPAEDFYQYACGGWVKNNPLPAAYSRYGSFDQLGESTEKQVHKIIKDVAAKSNKAGSNEQKIADLYNAGMDEKGIEELGVKPIQPLLSKIAAVKERSQLTGIIAELHDYGFTPFFGVGCMASPNDSRMNIAWLMQSGLGLGEREYYLTPDANIKAGYITMMQKLLAASGYVAEADAKQVANNVWGLETDLARIFIDKKVLRDPVATNNVMDPTKVASLFKTFDFNAYLKVTVPNGVDSVNVVLDKYFTGFDKLLKTKDLEVIKAYLACNLLAECAPYMSSQFVNAHFDFYGKTLSGKTQNKERWQRVVATISGLLGEPVGQLYVQQYFPPEAKEKMVHLVSNLKAALGDRIAHTDWMTDGTKARAKEKLETITVKVGYPDKWRDFSGLTIDKSGYLANILRALQFENDFELSQIGKPVDRNRWYMSPQTVNAYYEPTTNEICFPAAILQPPFFDMNADMAANYGAIGVVIGHEMTHGFDDQGRHYDKDGNVNDWWTEEDSKNFKARTQVLVDYFNGIEVLPGKFADGEFTLGENIADNGGLNTSFDALQRAKAEGGIAETMDGFTAEQRFFLAYAAVWANNITDAEIARRIATDPHSLGKWRVNGTLPHVDAFVKAFNIKEGDKMYIAPEKRAKIW